MTKRIFRSICLAAATVFVASLVISIMVLYNYFSEAYHDRLESQTKLTAHSLANEGVSFFDGLDTYGYRITWIDADGSVIYDTVSGSGDMANHSDREEYIEAVKNGYGESSRTSSTLTEKLIYSAQRLPDGTVIRLSCSQFTVLSLMPQMILPLTAIVLLEAYIAFQIAYRLSRKIVKPLNEIDLDHPKKDSGVYTELMPLLDRIEMQQNELKQQEEALRKKQNEFDTATENMHEGLILLNSDGKIISINRTASELLGIDCSGVGKSLVSLDPSPDLRSLIGEASGGSVAETVMSIDGLDYRFSASPVMSDGETAGIALLIFDITEKEKSELMRREFTANVSHEIKTPLHAISGYAEIMRDGLVKPEDTGEFAGRIYSETQRLITLVDDIIKLSRLDEGADGLMFEETHLLDIVRSAMQLLERPAEEMKISVSVGGDDVSVISVPHLVSGIIYNLCDNAIKYNRENGSVSVMVKDCGESAQIRVSDTGIGIPPDQKERIFERFYRVDKSRSKQVGGTGLGLSIVKHSATRIGAEIEVESVLNGGTAVIVRLPKERRRER